MKPTSFILGALLFLVSCNNSPENNEQTHNDNSTQAVPGNSKSKADSLPTTAAKSDKTKKQREEDTESIKSLNDDLECYDWNNTYIATTMVEDEEGDQFELYICINLNNTEKQNEYKGEIKMFLSGCEDQTFSGTVSAKAEYNHVTVYFDKNLEGMEDMFNHDDKLVMFEIAYGEYVASWFAPMHDYVDEYTLLSLGN